VIAQRRSGFDWWRIGGVLLMVMTTVECGSQGMCHARTHS